MRRTHIRVLAALGFLLTALPIQAQTGIGGSSAGLSSVGLGGLSTTGAGLGGGLGGSGGGLGGGSGASSGSGFSGGVQPIIGGAGVTGISGGSGTNGPSSIISSSNPLGTSYANPLFSGRIGSQLSDAPGGFGQVLYSVTSSTARSTGGRTGTTGATGIGGVPAGRAGATGGRANVAVSQGSTTTAGLPRPNIRYTISLKNAPAVLMPPPELQAQLAAMLARSSAISRAANVAVAVEPGSTVILSGRVADEEERRLVEGMVRLTPGVRRIENRLEAAAP